MLFWKLIGSYIVPTQAKVVKIRHHLVNNLSFGFVADPHFSKNISYTQKNKLPIKSSRRHVGFQIIPTINIQFYLHKNSIPYYG
jgi:hypothetical protein